MLVIDGGDGFDMTPRHFFASGAAAWLGPDATVCLLAIQSVADRYTGEAPLSVPRLALLTGLSERSIDRATARAIDLKYLKKLPTLPGRQSRWQVIRWIFARSGDGEQMPISYEYVPDQESTRRKAVGEAIKSGDFSALPPGVTVHVHVDQSVHIQQLQIVQDGGSGQQNQINVGKNVKDARNWLRKNTQPKQWDDMLREVGLSGVMTDQAVLALHQKFGKP